MKKAFTLVELLIVIALIAILSVAVLATINPIEQSNKARDAAQKNDAAEVLSAYERYYTSQNKYPWNTGTTVGTTIVASNVLPFGVSNGSTTDGVLITTSELKSSFAAKTPFKTSVAAIDIMYTYSDGVDSNYVCYVPKAKANRSLLGLLRCISGVAADGVKAPGSGSCVNIAADDAVTWAQTASYLSTSNAFWMCVPETASVPGVTGAP